MSATVAAANGPTNGPVCATTIVRSAARGTCRHTTAMNLTHIIEQQGDEFVVLRSPEAAEHSPDYFEMASFPARTAAESYIALQARTLSDLIDESKYL